MRSRKYDKIEKQKAAEALKKAEAAKAGKPSDKAVPKSAAGTAAKAAPRPASGTAAKAAPKPAADKAAKAAPKPAPSKAERDREKQILAANKKYEKETRKAEKRVEKAARKRAAGAAKGAGAAGFFKNGFFNKSKETLSFGESVKTAGLKRWQKISIIVLILIVVLGVTAYTAYRLYVNSKLDKINRVSVDPKNLSCVDVDGYANIVLLGVDTRNMKKKNLQGANTDCIVIVSMNEKTKKVNLISVYRDTYLRINGTITYEKVNSAFANGGAASTMKTLNEAADLNISKYVLFNFKMVADMVNAVGGIEVNVKKAEIQQLNKYTKETAKSIGQKKYKRVKKPGLQTLEGVQAVSYGRIRKGVGDDFKRTNRMRIVMSKVLGKLKKASFGELNNLMDTCMKQCETNLSNNDLLALAQRLSKVEINKSVGWPYNVTVGSLNGISYVFPAQLDKNVVRLHKALFGQENYKVSENVTVISNQIKANTGVYGEGYPSAKLGLYDGKGTSGTGGTAGGGVASGTAGGGTGTGTAGGTSSGTGGQSSTVQNGQNSTYNNNGRTSTYGSSQTSNGYSNNTRTTY
jgi:LCP family protein required for cell wall assembly